MAKLKTFGVKELQQEFMSIAKKDFPHLVDKMLHEMANRTLNRVKKKTPVDTGQARRSWQVGNLYKKNDDYYIEVFTDISYMKSLEFGHQYPNGNWYRGKFMLTLSIKELENDMPNLVRKFYNTLLKELRM